MAIEMPIEVLAGLVVLGVPAFLAIMAFSGPRASPVLTVEALLKEQRHLDPGAAAERFAVSDDASSALMLLTDGRIVAGMVMGDGLTTRVLDADGLQRVEVRGVEIRLQFQDAGLPALAVLLSDPSVREPWQALLSQLARRPR